MLLRRKFDPSSGSLVWEAIMVVMAAIIILLFGTGITTNGTNIYLTGVTESSDLIATPGAWKTSTQAAGTSQIFVSCFDASEVFCNGVPTMEMEIKDPKIVIGIGAFPLRPITAEIFMLPVLQHLKPVLATAGAWQTSYGRWYQRCLHSKIQSFGIPHLGTYFGGEDYDLGQQAIALDACDNVYVSGLRFPPRHRYGRQLEAQFFGTNKCFYNQFDPSGTQLWGTYYGGENTTQCYDMALDAGANIYITGWTGTQPALPPRVLTRTL